MVGRSIAFVMPEALVIFAVFVVVAASFVAAWVRSRDPSLQNPHEDFARLKHQAAWLEQRLETARRENWGSEMVAVIAAQCGETSEQLAVARVRVERR